MSDVCCLLSAVCCLSSIVYCLLSIVYSIFVAKIRFKLKKVNPDFYLRKDVVEIAKELLGKILVTNVNGVHTSARIVETEAYVAITDKASHSYNGKRTNRNEHMYAKGGIFMFTSAMECTICLM